MIDFERITMVAIKTIIEDAYAGFKEFYGFEETEALVYVQTTPIISISGCEQPISAKIFEDCVILGGLSYDHAARMFPVNVIMEKNGMLLVRGEYEKIIGKLIEYNCSDELNVAVGCLGEYNVKEDIDDIIDIISLSVFGDYEGEAFISINGTDFDILMI